MASGRINGVCSGGTNPGKYSFWIEWSSSAIYYDEGKPYATVTATSYLKRNDGYADSAYDLSAPASDKKISVDGVQFTGSTKGIDTRNNKTVTIATAKQVVYYTDASGVETITISSSFAMNANSIKTGYAEEEITLDIANIPQMDVGVEVTEVGKNYAKIIIATEEEADKWSYSLNGGAWVDFEGMPQSASIVSATIYALSLNATYNLVVMARQKSTGISFKSEPTQIITTPIYVTDILVEDPYKLDYGVSQKLSYVVAPENASIKTVDVVSSNPDIISVSGSTLNPKQKGEVTLTITAKDGSGVSKTITATSYTRVKGISVVPESINLPVGTEFQVGYVIMPTDADNKSVVVVSSDNTIVSVEGNKLTGASSGEAVVTITTDDGGYSANLYVSVTEGYRWFNYSKPIEILNTEDIARILSNINTIQSLLYVKGYSVAELYELIPQKDIVFRDVFDFLQKIEYNLDIISDNDAKSIYYGGSKQIGDIAPNRNEIWRWVQILNDMYNILMGNVGKWQYLACNDGYPTINGKKILLRGEIIG